MMMKMNNLYRMMIHWDIRNINNTVKKSMNKNQKIQNVQIIKNIITQELSLSSILLIMFQVQMKMNE